MLINFVRLATQDCSGGTIYDSVSWSKEIIKTKRSGKNIRRALLWVERPWLGTLWNNIIDHRV